MSEGRRFEVVTDDTRRCDRCFGPMPCKEHENIETLDQITTHNISPTSVLAGAHEADLEGVVVVGFDKNGREYFASSIVDAAPAIYYLQRGVYKLNKVVDGEFENENVGPKPA